MRRIISALLISISTTLPLAHGAKPLDLADGAPDRHVVVSGDTLWGIAAKFLKDPYRWGELWKLNAEQIRNPQLIYPGQVIVLDRSGKQPRVSLVTIREARREYVEPLRKGIPSIPPEVIEPFLSEPRVLDMADLDAAPRVVAVQDNRVIAGAGDTVFATEVTARDRLFPIFLRGDARFTPDTAGTAPVTTLPKLWQIFRPGPAFVDPDTRETLGYEAFFLGTARLTQEGVPSGFLVLTSKQEIAAGDRLLPQPRQDVPNYLPHPPAKMITGRVLAMYDGVSFGGPQSVVAVNRGKADGLEVGHVLAVDVAGATVTDRSTAERTDYQLPDTRNGLMFVFRVFDRISYALIMSATRPIVVGDTVRTP